LVGLEEFTPISGCSDSQNFPPTAVGSGSSLGSAPNSVPGASPAQLPYAARAASSAVRLRLSLRTSLLAGIVRFGALSNITSAAPVRLLAAAPSHVGISPQGNATKTSTPVREFLCRLRHGLQPLWLSASTPLGGGSTSLLLNWLSRKLLSC